MKGKFVSKILIVFLMFVVVLPLFVVSVAAENKPTVDTTIRDRIDQQIINLGRTPAEQADKEGLYRLLKMQDTQSKVDEVYNKVVSDKLSKEDIRTAINGFTESLPGLVNMIKDAQNGGDFDTAACIDSVVSTVSSLLILVPYGEIIAPALELCNTVFKMVMGGEASTSEMAKMEDRLTQQLDDIQNQLSGIEEQINELSNQINDAVNDILNGVTIAVDNAFAKQELRNFMLTSGKYDFGYNQYRNYLYGELENNSMANTAYYSLLKKSLTDGSSESIVKYYYDALYTSLMNNWDSYYDAIIGTSDSKSIVQSYYDVVSARSDLMNKKGTTPEYEAIMFAYDIYQTELMTSQIIMSCNLYQYLYMCSTNTDYYVYDQYNGGIVEKWQIEGQIQEQIDNRFDDIHTQLACDIAYVLGLDNFYLVKAENGDLFEVVNNDPDTYGKILENQTIYLNSIPEEVCNMFGFDYNSFYYEISVPTEVDGSFIVDDDVDSIDAKYYYKTKELNQIHFDVGTNAKFNGGSGTASDPYLIASASQFSSITQGLDKHYRLIQNIDFEGTTISPIGQKINSNNVIVYDEFEGSFDGNGYEISNLNIVGYNNAGLFGIIGEDGEVANLNLFNIKVSAKLMEAEKDVSKFYAGVIAGKNDGIIKFCSVNSDGTIEKKVIPNYDLTLEQILNNSFTREVNVPIYGVFFELNNEIKDRSIYVYVGGITGTNNEKVFCCSIANNQVSGYSTHDFGGNGTALNKNNVFVGGLCGNNQGVLAYSVVNKNVMISSFAKSIYNPETTVNPFVTSYAGGVVAETSSLNNIFEIESNAEIILNEAELDCESRWGEHYNNCFDEKHTYIPNYSETILDVIKPTKNVETFISNTDIKHIVTFECPDTIYEAGSGEFNTKNLKFFIDGFEKDYEIINIFGFNSRNEQFNSVPERVAVLFGVEIDGKVSYFMQDISITIKENYVTNIEILNLKENYVAGKFSLEGLEIKYDYAVGVSKYVTITSEMINQQIVKYEGSISTFGTQSIVLLYNNDTINFEIDIVCGHGSNFTSLESGYVYDEELSKDPTCSTIGYDGYRCTTCGDEKYYYLRKVEHQIYECEHNYVDNKCDVCSAIKATCMEEGYTGKICCANCVTELEDGTTVPTILSEGIVMPKLQHNYVYSNENEHICTNGNHSEYHHYSITESVVLKTNDDGSESWYTVYTYTCVCMKDGKIYSKPVEDNNKIINFNENLPTIMVSDGYVVSGGDEVTVYVQLLNNPGISAANFGIRYSEGLELIEIQDGNLIKGSLLKDGLPVSYGYNFVWAPETSFEIPYFYNNGNLLKLTFKVSEYADLDDVYDVSLVYAIGNGADGGFGTKDGKKYFVTKAGKIKFVDHLPGDVNYDGVVDLMDALEIGKFIVGKTDNIDEKYANVDLSCYNDGRSNVDIMDMVAILQYITGGYGTNLLTNDFEIKLNTNGYDDLILDDLLVSIYDNNTYLQAGLPELQRKGYKFLGWSYQMVDGELIDINESVVYNSKQKKQTLYAQWELNKIIFDENGATSGEMKNLYYSDDDTPITIENNYLKEYNVIFVSDNSVYSDETDGVLKYELLSWEGSNGKTYNSLNEVVEDLRNANYGVFTVKPIWSENGTIKYPEWYINGYEEEISWYGTKDLLSITQIINNNDIINYPSINDYYTVYAKHTPIVYDIIFDLNGGDGNIPYSRDNTVVYDCSVENKYSLSQVKVTYTGKTLTGWVAKIKDQDPICKNFNPDEEIGYIPLVKPNDTVIIIAQWDITSYEITLNTNGGLLSEDSIIVTYNIDTIDKLVLPTPIDEKYPEYNKFVGWYDQNGKKYDPYKLKNNPENIDLFAQWDICKVYYNSINEKITSSRVIVDWRTIKDVGKQEIILENVSEIYFLGKEEITYTDVKIAVFGSLNNLNTLIYFNNFKIDGYIYQYTNSANLNITVHCEGEQNSITAPQGESAIKGFESLVFSGTGKIKISGSVYGNGTLQLVKSNSISCNDCIVTYEYSATYKSSNNPNNDYTFKGWFCGDQLLSESKIYVSKVTEFDQVINSAWYNPLGYSTTNYGDDDFSSISEVEKRKVSVSGGSGSYGYECGSDSGAKATYDGEFFRVYKEKDDKTGNAWLKITDNITKQTITYTVTWSTNGCFTGDTLVALADGTYARLDSLKSDDLVLSWNAFTGTIESMPISLFWNHGEGLYNVITLEFSNGKTLNVVTEHGFFDATLNKYVFINHENYVEYLGHHFAVVGEEGTIETVELVSGIAEYKWSSCYSLRSACNDNVIVEGFLTLTIEDIPGFLTYFEFGDDYKYDKEKMESDIAQYGLYTYEEWQDYVSYEEFIALNGQYLSIVVGKGYITREEILMLIEGMR